MGECWFPAGVESGPNAEGVYTLIWEDGDPDHRQVHASRARRTSTSEECGEPAPYELPEGDGGWTPPEIACTILGRMHWEGSDAAWNKDAVDKLKEEFLPDEVIDGFDWHVIFRFN